MQDRDSQVGKIHIYISCVSIQYTRLEKEMQEMWKNKKMGNCKKLLKKQLRYEQ